jgi:hypothetical protein
MARRIAVEIVGDSSSLERAFKRSATSASGFQSAIQRTSSKTTAMFGGLAKSVVAGVGITSITAGITNAIQAYSNLNEAINQNKVVFGSSSAEILKWSQTTANSLGISQRAALEATGGFGALLEPMGVSTDKAAQMGQGFVKLGADLGSFYNKPVDQALEAIRSGLVGESEPLRQFGIRLSEARIQQEALRLGLMKGAQAADAAKTAYKNASETFQAAHKAEAKATQELTKAQTELKSSRAGVEQSTRALGAAQDRVRTTTEGVTDAEDRQQSASEQLTNAKQALTNAQKAGKDAQVALTQARKDATTQLKELKNSAIDAALSEERAQLSLDQARQRLKDTMADQNATDLDRRDAILGVKEAENNLQDAQDRRTDTAKKARDADEKGVEGAKNVIDAKKKLAKANQDEDSAAQKVGKAQRVVADAQRGLATAQANAAKAQTNLATAQANASAANERYVTAQEKLTAAQATAESATKRAQTAEDKLAAAKKKSDDLNKGRKKGITDEARALAVTSLIYKDSTKAQGDFGRTAGGLANTQKRLGAAAENTSAMIGGKLAPSVTTVANAVANWLTDSKNQEALLNTLNTVFGTAKTLIDTLRGAFDLLSTAVGGSKNALKLLIAMYASWKIANIVSKITTLTTSFTNLKGGIKNTRTASGNLRTSLIGKAGVAAAVVGAGIELSNLIRKIPGWDKAMKDFGGTIHDLATNLGLVKDPMAKFEGKAPPSQRMAGRVRGQAAILEHAGLAPRQAAGVLAGIHPGLAQHDIEVLAGVTGKAPVYNIQNLHLNGIQDVGAMEAQLLRRAGRRPHPRR